MNATIHSPYYEWDGRKYLELKIYQDIFRVKIPFRYGRVMCKIEGLKTVQEFKKGDKVEVVIETKNWHGVLHKVLCSIKEVT